MPRTPSVTARRATWQWLGAAFLYVAVTALFFGPHAQEIGTKFIGDGGDSCLIAWNAWWLKYALAHGFNPYFCHMQMAPFGVPLVFHELMPIPSLIMIGLLPFGPVHLAYNLLLIALYPLAGLTTFALARFITGSFAGALVGGLVYMISPYMVSKSLGHLNLLWAGLLPLFTLVLLKGVRPRGWKWRWWMALLFVVMLFSNIHTTIFAGNIALWYFVYRVWTGASWRAEFLRLWRLFRLSAVVAGLWLAFVLYYAVTYRLRAGIQGDPAFCPELLNYVLPVHFNSVWRAAVAPAGEWGEKLANVELATYLGWLVMPLAAAGWWCRRHQRGMKIMLLLFLCAFVLSLGPKVQWQRKVVRVGRVPLYLPLRLYRYVPLFGAIGQSGRYMAITYMPMGVGVAALIAAIGRRRGRPAGTLAAAIFSGLVCLDYAFRPVFTEPAPAPIPPGPGRVLAPRRGDARSLYFQIRHERELVGGYICRTPMNLWSRYREMEGIGWFFLDEDERGDPPAPVQALAGFRALDVRYVTVDRGSTDQAFLRRCGGQVIQDHPWGATIELPADWALPAASP